MTAPPTTPPADAGPLFTKPAPEANETTLGSVADLEFAIARALTLTASLPKGRYVALVSTKLEEAQLWLAKISGRLPL